MLTKTVSRLLVVATSATVVATSAALATTASAHADTTPAATHLTLTPTSNAVTYPSPVGLNGRLTLADGTTPVPSQQVYVYARPYGYSAIHIATVTTDANGNLSYSTRTDRLTSYQLKYPGTTDYALSSSPEAAVNVAPKLTASMPAGPTTYSTFNLTGTTAPALPNARVQIFRSLNGAWHWIANWNLRSNGTLVYPLRFATAGRIAYTFKFLGDADHLAKLGPPAFTTVYRRTMVEGDSGADVLDLQRRLAAYHYDVGAANGSFGYDTYHAVVAFQKINGLSRDGAVGSTTLAKLARPVTPKLRYPMSGHTIEVDIGHQVVYYSYNGAIQRIMDSSTGSGHYYYEDGTYHLAYTPRGRFHIVRKVDGMVTSKLGQLWRPAYFNWDGYAIHGNGSVPAYPASHGCVRITNPAMNRMFNLIYVGMPFAVYD